MSLDDSEKLPIYNDESGKAPSLGSGLPLNRGIIDLGYGNIISPSARMVLINGNNNTIGENVFGATLLNSSGVTVAGNLTNVSVLNSSGVTITDPNTITNQNVTIKPTQVVSKKVYRALISQASINNPTVIILENGIGNIVWTITDLGIYIGTLAGAFTLNKTFYTQILRSQINSTQFGNVRYFDSDTITINTWSDYTMTLAQNDVLSKSPIEIIVYD